LEDWKKKIAQALVSVCEVEFEDAYNSLCQPKGGQADWCSTLAFIVAKKEKKNPAQICAHWAKSQNWPKIVKRVEAVGSYLNFYFSNEFWG